MNPKPKIVYHRIMLLFLVIAVVLSGCSTHNTDKKSEEPSTLESQSTETKSIEKKYPFSLSENATVVEYPSDNMYALTSVIRDVNEDGCILALEFDKNSEREDAMQFALSVSRREDILGCVHFVDVGVESQLLESDGFFIFM